MAECVVLWKRHFHVDFGELGTKIESGRPGVPFLEASAVAGVP